MIDWLMTTISHLVPREADSKMEISMQKLYWGMNAHRIQPGRGKVANWAEGEVGQ